MVRKEIWIAAVVVLLAGIAVWGQLRGVPEVPRRSDDGTRIEVGEALDPDIVLLDLDG